MTLFIYGEFGPMAMEKSMIPVWENLLGPEKVHQIERISLPKNFQIIERACRKFVPQYSRQIEKHNESIIEQIASSLGPKSGLIVFKGMEVFPETMKTIKKLGVNLFCYNPDHPFVYSGPGSGSRFMTQCLPLYDLYFTYHHEAQKQLSEMSIKNHLIPFGYEPGAIKQPLVSPEKEILRGCFIGNPNPERVAFFKDVTQEIPLDLYGSKWEKYFKPSNELRIHGPVHDQVHWELMSRYRFQFNLMARHNLNAHNMRTFSAPASGAIMLAPRNRDHELYFRDREEVLLFDSIQNCISLGRQLLNLPFDEALCIRRAARNRCIESGYSYLERAKEILENIFTFLKRN